jgi:hypothetical protein
LEAIFIHVKTFLWALAFTAATELSAHAAQEFLSSGPLILTITRLVELAGILILFRACEKRLPAGMETRLAWIRGLRRGVVWSGSFAVLTAVLWGILILVNTPVPMKFQFTLPDSPVQRLMILSAAILLGPATEEVFFRGVVYGFLRRWGVLPALVLSTAAFALAHGGPHFATLPRWIGGLLFAAAYEAEKNLWVPLTIHVLGNAALVGISSFT